MSTFESIWKKLRRSKRYREQFVADHAKRAIPHQAQSIMIAKGLNQMQLAKRANISQGVVSRAVDPSYGNLTLNTIIRIAAGFDLAFVGRFVPFSELARWYTDLPDQDWNIPTFEQEDAQMSATAPGAISMKMVAAISGWAPVEVGGTKKPVQGEKDAAVVMRGAYGPPEGSEVRLG